MMSLARLSVAAVTLLHLSPAMCASDGLSSSTLFSFSSTVYYVSSYTSVFSSLNHSSFSTGNFSINGTLAGGPAQVGQFGFTPEEEEITSTESGTNTRKSTFTSAIPISGTTSSVPGAVAGQFGFTETSESNSILGTSIEIGQFGFTETENDSGDTSSVAIGQFGLTEVTTKTTPTASIILLTIAGVTKTYTKKETTTLGSQAGQFGFTETQTTTSYHTAQPEAANFGFDNSEEQGEHHSASVHVVINVHTDTQNAAHTVGVEVGQLDHTDTITVNTCTAVPAEAGQFGITHNGVEAETNIAGAGVNQHVVTTKAATSIETTIKAEVDQHVVPVNEATSVKTAHCECDKITITSNGEEIVLFAITAADTTYVAFQKGTTKPALVTTTISPSLAIGLQAITVTENGAVFVATVTSSCPSKHETTLTAAGNLHSASVSASLNLNGVLFDASGMKIGVGFRLSLIILSVALFAVWI